MADAKIHENQAKHNYTLLTLLKNEFRDWRITVAFYTAIHLIDCQLEQKAPNWKRKYLAEVVDEGWYGARNKAINYCFKDIYNNYRMLMEKSRIMRYLEAEAANKKAIDAITEKDAKNLIDKHLGAILAKFHYNW